VGQKDYRESGVVMSQPQPPWIIPPTGTTTIRSDSWGDGRFGARRTKKTALGTILYSHTGIDYFCIVGQQIVAPFDGEIIRIGQCYPYDTRFKLIEIQGNFCRGKILYVDPHSSSRRKVKQGDLIGTAQDIGLRYDDKMLPHIHFEINAVDPGMFMECQELL